MELWSPGPATETPVGGGVEPPAVKALTPAGVPSPVGPSQPVRALQTWVPQVPLLPLVTSLSAEVCA
ncbi:hypothetical protein [Kitasatospora sp. MMS16-BH015]|uniref:hypothetical protein n=1 Tax=Kitasatospora sp. MMS16-BH015 TaxID=2018025 RepID=UPI00131A5944|nr:hypothetical protein [Kitasatospora sp. MMS16-BH015]